jgi:formylglycine-generating enzyme required for sulfatase activity
MLSRSVVLSSALMLLGGCNALFDIGSPERAADGVTGGGGSTGSGTAAGSGTGASAGSGAGPSGGGGVDITGMIEVPPNSFLFGDPGGTQTTATLTRGFLVDKLEVTVERFAEWVEAGQPTPCSSGSCTLDPGGPYETSMQWEATWNSDAASTAYGNATPCDEAMQFISPPLTWATPGNQYPINCVSWYHAVAFCAFEGKRLMTETEWEYLAGYGHPTDPYPWGADAPTCEHALWNQDAEGTNPCGFPKAGGSTPLGGSQLGAQDLAGSLFEWTWDWHNDYPTTAVTDYTGAATPHANSGMSRVTRGGSWAAAGFWLDVHKRDFTYVTGTYGDIGIRCALSAR